MVRLLAIVALLLFCPGCAEPPPEPEAVPEPMAVTATQDESPEEQAFLAEIDRSVGYRDCFTVLRDPVPVAGADATHMNDQEMVIGLDLGRVQMAYPVNYLNAHEIVEQTLEGLDLLVCW